MDKLELSEDEDEGNNESETTRLGSGSGAIEALEGIFVSEEGMGSREDPSDAA